MVIFRAALLFVVTFGAIIAAALIWHPQSPLPDAWNPSRPLRVSDPVTLLTGWKLDRALATPESCLAALNGAARLSLMEDFENSAQCHIRDRVAVTMIGASQLNPVETRCGIALRLAMWEHHSLQPAARNFLQTDISGITQIGSYNCRPIRTSNGSSGRMSTHATADAIDITGFRFADGTGVSLMRDWDSANAKSAFLRAVRDGACTWFRVTLSPEYNQLHADHFHLQNTGWGLYR